MGCFGGKKAPALNIPPPPQLPTATDLFNEALALTRKEFPLSLQAREQGIGRIGELNVGPDFFQQFQTAPFQEIMSDFFQQFQPTSFEETLGNQYFQNVVPDLERSIKHNLSLSGMASSPILAEQIAKMRGNVGVDIGNILAQLGQQRAELALGRQTELANLGQQRAGQALQSRATGISSLLGVDPMNTLLPYVGTGAQQGNLQAELQRQDDLLRAQIQYQQALDAGKRRSSLLGTIGNLGGAGLGFLVGGPAGAAIGSGLGGVASGLFGGQAPVDLGTAIGLAQLPGQFSQQKSLTDLFNSLVSGGGGSAQPVYESSPNISPRPKMQLPQLSLFN